MGWEYSEKTKKLFLDAVHGKPGTHLGEVENPDGVGEHGSIACGDALRFTFKVERNNDDPTKDIIVEARYLTFGCTSAIAASEALCCIIEDKRITPIEALQITNEDIVEFLEGLPQQKIHCSVMGAEALEAAVFDWAKRRNIDLTKLGIESHTSEEEDGRLVCKCFGMTEPYIKRKIKELNLHTIPEITGAIKAGGACMGCHHASSGLQDILNEVWGSPQASDSTNQKSNSTAGTTSAFIPLATLDNSKGQTDNSSQKNESIKTTAGATLSPYQRAKKIEQMIDSYIRPMIQRDGGNIDIIDIKDNLIFVQLTGACANCSGASQTLKILVERTLQSQVDPNIRVVQV
ncbi:MAG: iron-sulfur cluster assembly scaffold protein [Planctomycetia bacterium]|nr:iron-sulfur cluster assembly scaffold protein [Planctomycetia bacterium]